LQPACQQIPVIISMCSRLFKNDSFICRFIFDDGKLF
jgi:hypothetical protein